MNRSNKKAIVLLSGGLDSSTVLAIAKSEGFQIHAMTFQYGQRHAIEIKSAKLIAKHSQVQQHVIVDIETQLLTGSALTDDIDVPKGREMKEICKEIPVTYVPNSEWTIKL